MPIIHLPTFLAEPRVHLLVKATKAAGAVYHDTPAATNFVEFVLSTVRDEIITELVRNLSSCMSECISADPERSHIRPITTPSYS